MFLSLLAVLGASAQPQVEPDCGGNTRQIAACFSRAAQASEAQMEKYLEAALVRLEPEEYWDEEHREWSHRAAAMLRASQVAYEGHRKLECDAVYAHFAMGTIRMVEYPACLLVMNNQRTHAIWQRWLTYPDGTPPILPEPKPISAN